MKVIYRYRLHLGEATIETTEGATILSVQMQQGQICVWMECLTGAKYKQRTFTVIGTGHPFDGSTVQYVNTVQDGSFVWHVYEVIHAAAD
jgi:hypothetical protein